jgi:hypothetical protein
MDGEDQQALFLELSSKARFAVGRVNAFDDLSARCPEPAPIFHY